MEIRYYYIQFRPVGGKSTDIYGWKQVKADSLDDLRAYLSNYLKRYRDAYAVVSRGTATTETVIGAMVLSDDMRTAYWVHNKGVTKIIKSGALSTKASPKIAMKITYYNPIKKR